MRNLGPPTGSKSPSNTDSTSMPASPRSKPRQTGALKSRFLLPVLIIGLAAGVAFALIKSRPEAKPVEVKEKAWLVSVQPVTPAERTPVITLYGRVESLWSSQLTAGVAADVRSIEVIEGDDVFEGQLLLSLDDRDIQLLLVQREAALREAESRIEAELSRHRADRDSLPREKRLLALARDEVERVTNLANKKLGSQSQLDTAREAVERQAIAVNTRTQAVRDHKARLAQLESERDRAAALRDQMQLELERTRITAPFNGRIAKVLVSPGSRVRNGDALVQLYDTDAMVLRAQLPARHLPVVRQARQRGAELQVSGEIDAQPVKAQLLRLAGEVSSGSGGVEALFQIDGAADVLQQGRFVQLDLRLPPQPMAIALPFEAVYGTDRVYRVDREERMRSVRVERLGEARSDDGRSLILVRSNELADGDRVVITQLPNALDGLLVRVPQDLGEAGPVQPQVSTAAKGL